MATKRLLAPLHRLSSSLLSFPNKTPLHTLQQLQNPIQNLQPTRPISSTQRHFSSHRRISGTYDLKHRHPNNSNKKNPSPISQDDDDDDDDDDTDDEDEDEEEEDELSENEDVGDVKRLNADINRTYSIEETAKEAEEIGYEVVGPLDPTTERPFKHREPYFAVVQIGSHQFKVSNGDSIYTEKLKFCEVNDKLILKKVLMVGSQSQTIIGRPILSDAIVHAVVEEHALDAKVIIFKKKRRKNYRRTKGHRQELTRLRITDIQGIEKPEKPEKPEKLDRRERLRKQEDQEMAAVAA